MAGGGPGTGGARQGRRGAVDSPTDARVRPVHRRPGEGASGCLPRGDDDERRGRDGESDKDKILARIEESDVGVILEEGAN